MLRFRALTGLSGALLAALLFTADARGSIVEALELPELVAQADQIILGRVVLAEPFQRADGTIATWYRIEVERSLRGDADDAREVIVETMGGQIGDLGMRVEGEPSFSVGERALIFMRDGGQIAFRPVGMAQGVMRIRMDGEVETVFQSRAGLMLVRRAANGQLVRSRGALPNKERLDTFLSRVRTIIREQAGASRE